MQKLVMKVFLSVEQPDIENLEKGSVQRVNVIEPAYKDSFGDSKGSDQEYQILFWNDRIKTLPKFKEALAAAEKTGEPVKAEIIGYLNGSKRKTDDGREFYNCFIAGTEMKLL